ncbi:MAG TPA: hypothetical protein VG605_13340 [Puia sp.]|nr:hypothetical protein [Puia sp.]
MNNLFDSKGFRREIERLGTALFTNYGDALVKLPNCIVSGLRVDEMGDIWFKVISRCLYMEEEEKVFPVGLNVYNKIFPVSVAVQGVARIVAGEWDPDAAGTYTVRDAAGTGAVRDAAGTDTVRFLVRLKVDSVEYQRRGHVSSGDRTGRYASGYRLSLARFVTELIARTDRAQRKERPGGLILSKSF